MVVGLLRFSLFELAGKCFLHCKKCKCFFPVHSFIRIPTKLHSKHSNNCNILVWGVILQYVSNKTMFFMQWVDYWHVARGCKFSPVFTSLYFRRLINNFLHQASTSTPTELRTEISIILQFSNHSTTQHPTAQRKK